MLPPVDAADRGRLKDERTAEQGMDVHQKKRKMVIGDEPLVRQIDISLLFVQASFAPSTLAVTPRF